MRIGLLGDSTTEVNYLSPGSDWPALLAAQMAATVDNWGDSGKATLDFLTGGSNRAWWSATAADYYVISFGYNDVSFYTSAAFKTHTASLIADAQGLGAIAVLMTQPVVDYPDHYTIDRNPTIEDYNSKYAELADEQGLMLVDLGAHIASRIAQGDWDWRIRNYTLLAPPDDSFSNPDVWDDTLDSVMEPIHGALWSTNIHGNLREQPERASLLAAHLLYASAAPLASIGLVSGVASYVRVLTSDPAAIHIAWDALANFGGTHAIYSSGRADAVTPDDGDPVNAEQWSLEPLFAFPGADGKKKGCKVLHLGNWRARHLLFAVTPSSSGGVVEFFRDDTTGDMIH